MPQRMLHAAATPCEPWPTSPSPLVVDEALLEALLCSGPQAPVTHSRSVLVIYHLTASLSPHPPPHTQFVDKAPPAVVAEAQGQAAEMREQLAQIDEKVGAFSKLA